MTSTYETIEQAERDYAARMASLSEDERWAQEMSANLASIAVKLRWAAGIIGSNCDPVSVQHALLIALQEAEHLAKRNRALSAKALTLVEAQRKTKQ